MELRQLEHFVAVAEERHFTRAAARVGIVQSGLSESVRSLEHELGVPLFERGPRRVALTTAGEALLPDARRALEAAQAGREAVGAVVRLKRGRLVIGLAQDVAPRLDPMSMVGDFSRDYPDIELCIRVGPSDPIAALRAGRFDLLFTPILGPLDEDLESTVVIRDRMAVACPPGHRLVQRQRVALAELAREPFVDLSAPSVTRSIVDRAFGSSGLARKTAVEVDGPRAALALVESGVGIALLPAGASSLAPGVVFRPLVDDLACDLAIVRRTDGVVSPAMREFMRRATRRCLQAASPARPGDVHVRAGHRPPV